MGMGWVLGGFVVFGWDPVEISLSIRFEGKSRAFILIDPRLALKAD